jgi:hypothetical protein
LRNHFQTLEKNQENPATLTDVATFRWHSESAHGCEPSAVANDNSVTITAAIEAVAGGGVDVSDALAITAAAADTLVGATDLQMLVSQRRDNESAAKKNVQRRKRSPEENLDDDKIFLSFRFIDFSSTLTTLKLFSRQERSSWAR